MDHNANFNGQQRPNQYQQQQNQQQSQQHDYSQQAQQNMQQQPTYQPYQQVVVPAVTPSPVANTGNQQMQYSQAPPNIQGQVATNGATTTTTTTTTKKSTKLMQALQAASPPPPTPAQSPPAVDFSQLMQSAPPLTPPTQQNMGFSQLLQAALQPQPSQSRRADRSRAEAGRGASSSSNTRTTTASTIETVGSASRQQAASQGGAELRHFDQDVSTRLKRIMRRACPMGFDFYAVREGYLCGGGHHFVEHEEVEDMLKYGHCPRLECVNRETHERPVTPPPGDGNGSGGEPAFWTAEEQLRHGLYPFARLRDPRWNARLNWEGRRRRR